MILGSFEDGCLHNGSNGGADGDDDDEHLAGTRVEGEDRGRRSLFPPSGFSDNHLLDNISLMIFL